MKTPTSTITTKGQVTIPKHIRDSLHLDTGDKVEFIFKDNEVIIKPITKKASDVAGLLSKYRKDNAVSIEDMNEAIKQRMKDNA